MAPKRKKAEVTATSFCDKGIEDKRKKQRADFDEKLRKHEHHVERLDVFLDQLIQEENEKLLVGKEKKLWGNKWNLLNADEARDLLQALGFKMEVLSKIGKACLHMMLEVYLHVRADSTLLATVPSVLRAAVKHRATYCGILTPEIVAKVNELPVVNGSIDFDFVGIWEKTGWDEERKSYTEVVNRRKRSIKWTVPEKVVVDDAWPIEKNHRQNEAYIENPDPDMGQTFRFHPLLTKRKVEFEEVEYRPKISDGGKSSASRSSGSTTTGSSEDGEVEEMPPPPPGWGGNVTE